MGDIHVMKKDNQVFVMIQNSYGGCKRCHFNKDNCPNDDRCVANSSFWEKIDMNMFVFNPFSINISR